MIHAHPRTTPGPAQRRRHAARAPDRETEELDWAAAGWAGLAAGLAMILLETSFASMFGSGSAPNPVRRIAAIALSQAVLPPLSPFTAVVFVAAMSVHLPLSLIYARVLALFLRRSPPGRAAAVGLAFGAALYALNYYALSWAFPWFTAARGWITLASHLAFGAIAAVLYVLLRERDAARAP